MHNINIYLENNKIIIGNVLNINDGNVRIIAGARPQDIYYIVDEMMIKKDSVQIIAEPTFLDHFKSELIYIQAGGGLVKNELNETLMIFRNEKWDLPKGKLESGENIADCALREVIEETGVQQLQLQNFIKHTFHIYPAKNNYVFKHTHWYAMQCPKQNLIAQAEEGITNAVWANDVDVKNYLQNTYGNIKDVIGN
jgi:8-oxo-(d)GTP phosphatase